MKILTIFVLIISIVITTAAYPLEESLPGDDYTPEKISSFTISLIDHGEYYRGYVELLRLKSFYPSYISYPVFDITKRYIFYNSRKYEELVSFDLSKIPGDRSIPSGLFLIDGLIKLDRIAEAETELNKLYSREDSDKFSRYMKKRSVYISLLDENTVEKENGEDFLNYEELFHYSKTIHQGRKNPFLGALAGIIPGMGFVYAGETGTGFVSLFIIGAGSAVTYASYRDGFGSLAFFTGLITFFFYGGSIAGGYMQSERYNNRQMETLRARLDNELLMERDLDEFYFKFGLKSR